MTEQAQQQLGATLWGIADELRGSMNADDFRDYMLSFLFLRYLSDRYEETAREELGPDYPAAEAGRTPLQIWYANNAADVPELEELLRRRLHYVIPPDYLWSSIAELARTQNDQLLKTLLQGFRHIEDKSFESSFRGLFSEINLTSEKLGKEYAERNAMLCRIITRLAEELAAFSTDVDTLGDAYEYLIGQFAAGSGKKQASSTPRSRFPASSPPL